MNVSGIISDICEHNYSIAVVFFLKNTLEYCELEKDLSFYADEQQQEREETTH